MAPVIRAPSVEPYWNHKCQLPYGLTTDQVRLAVEDLYDFFYQVNSLLVERAGLDFLEAIVLGNTLSGMMSEFLVRRIAEHSNTLARNARVGGHPDLIPPGAYQGNSVLRGEGVEVKTSKQGGGWQGHNPEEGWLIVFRYVMGDQGQPPGERQPIRFVQILAGQLTRGDWSLAERGQQSRRTRTTSINEGGMHKLRSNPVYQDPTYIVAPSRELRAEYAAINLRFARG